MAHFDFEKDVKVAEKPPNGHINFDIYSTIDDEKPTHRSDTKCFNASQMAFKTFRFYHCNNLKINQ